MSFNPNSPCAPNGNIFSFDCSPRDAKIILVPLPWDVTASYQTGASLAPEAILNASLQLDFFDETFDNTWNLPVFMLPIQSEMIKLNNETRELAKKIIDYQSGNHENTIESIHLQHLFFVNETLKNFHTSNYNIAKELINQNKIPCFIGGEHSIAWGLMKALSEKESFSVLHIDAHADLRKEYEGFLFSHASIMHNATQLKNIERFVHVAIRDYCIEENNLILSDSNYHRLYSDKTISERLFNGNTWSEITNEIVSSLTSKVYISFDIDGLEHSCCPHTGTPVPGGLSFNQAKYLLERLRCSGKQILGFDLSEVAPDKSGNNEIDANIAARVLLELLKAVAGSNNLM